MRKLVAYTLLSLDGVAESPNRYMEDFDGEMLANLGEVIGAQDTVLLGRRTYDEWAGYWPNAGSEPFASFINGVRKYVPTSTRPATTWAHATFISSDFEWFVRERKRESGGDIGVHGSITLTRHLLRAGLIDELRLVIAPVLAGAGRRLFTAEDERRRLRLLRTRGTSSGGILADYAVRTD
jgi:dihydrofolate reductase